MSPFAMGSLGDKNQLGRARVGEDCGFIQVAFKCKSPRVVIELARTLKAYIQNNKIDTRQCDHSYSFLSIPSV